MLSKLSSAFICAGIYLVLSGCDPTTAPKDPLGQGPDVRSITIDPVQVNFTPEDGFKDTTITVTIEAQINSSEEATPGYVVKTKENQVVIRTGDLTMVNSNLYSADVQLITSTSAFEDYIIEAFAYDEGGNGNYVQTEFSITGFSNNRPEILEIFSPDSVDLPSSGSKVVRFIAKATDDDGQSTIDNVFLRLISRNTGELSGSPFSLVDDATSGDEIANDSLFTTSFNISSGNNPETYDVEYYALDKGGLYSDTVRTTFTIRGNN